MSGQKALVLSPPETWSIVKTDGTGEAEKDKPDSGEQKLNIAAIEVRIDPRAEWEQIFDEAWRHQPRLFLRSGHARRRLAGGQAEVRGLSARTWPRRSDLYRVMRWMLSELGVGHSYLFPSERLDERRGVPGGLLGADYEVAHGRYRFKKVYGGLNWNPGLRSPLTAAGVDVKPGEYLLAVRGIELRPPTELFSLFENTAEKSIEITVGPNTDGRGSRTVTVEPLGDEMALRNRDWVEGNLKRSARRPAAGWPTFTCPTPRPAATITSNATSIPSPTATPSSSTSVSTAADKWPTTASSTLPGRPCRCGPPATAPTSASPARRSTARRSC